MAKSKSKDDGRLGGIVIAIIIIVIIAIYVSAFLVPIILLVGSIAYYSKASTLKKKINGEISDYWLTNKEKREYRESKKRLNKAEELIIKAEKKGKDNNVSINKDGSFSKRSKLGKEINAVLDKQTPIARKNMTTVLFLEQLPKKRWENDLENLSEFISKSRGFLWSLASWVILVIYFGIESNWNIQINIRLALITTLIPVVIYFIAKWVSMSNNERYLSDTPPNVSKNNIDEYKASHNFKYGSAVERN